MIKSTLSLVAFLLIIIFPAKAKYTPLDIYEMIIKADKIVFGEIVEVKSTTFTFKISESPTNDAGEIVIQKFNDWPCASRWNDYKVGQQLLIFVSKWKGKFFAMSGGNEGELPILNDSVYIHGFSVPTPLPPSINKEAPQFFIKSKHYLIDNNEYYGYRMSLSDMRNAIQFIRSCFDYTKGSYNKPTNWTISCDEEEIMAMANKNKIVEWTYLKAKEKD